MNAENEYKETPIFFAANSGKFVRNLLCALKSFFFFNVISFSGEVEIFRILVENGAKVDIEIENKVTPLHYAVYSILGKISIHSHQLFLSNGVFFFFITFPGQADIIRYLIEHGANVSAETFFKETPLHWAANSGKS